MTPSSGPDTRQGAFVAIAGPSGVGKDTLINYARAKLAADPRYLFVRRAITRAPDPTGEGHVSVAPAEFARRHAAGEFALTWSAHGLEYGLPRAVDRAIESGLVVVANISRAIIPALEARYARVLGVLVTADPSLVRNRLAQRDRESAADIAARITREVGDAPSSGWTCLDNSGSIAEAGDRLVAVLERAAGIRAGMAAI